MVDLSAFPITACWPAKHPDRLQLYSLPTPNGVKVSIALEEIGPQLRTPPRRHRQERVLDLRVSVPQSQRQDPRNPRPKRS